jgi:hypothetical protein
VSKFFCFCNFWCWFVGPFHLMMVFCVLLTKGRHIHHCNLEISSSLWM